MTEQTASRTLVKSAPELWAQCSDPESLGRHLQGFGEIRITRLEPERSVSWETEHAAGTIVLEPSGWGTKVTLAATPAARAPEGTPEPTPRTAPEPTPRTAPEPAREPARLGLLARLLRRPRRPDTIAPPPAAVPEAAAPDPVSLDAALDSLGQAHHRPFSRD